MGLRIGTNTASIAAQRNLSRISGETGHAIRALSSGQRIVNAGDDAAGWAISESLRGQAESLKQAKKNSENAVGLIQVAEGGLNEQNNILIRLRELAVQAASDTIGDDERGFLNTEFQQLVAEFDRIAVTTRYANKPLLTGTNEEFQFHLGTGSGEEDIIKYRLDADSRADSLGIDDLAVDDKSDARSALQSIDTAVLSLSKTRSGFGAIQSRLEIAGNNLDLQRENVLAARSRIADADVAEEVSKLVHGQVMQEIGMSVLAQANQMPMRALKLLG